MSSREYNALSGIPQLSAWKSLGGATLQFEDSTSTPCKRRERFRSPAVAMRRARDGIIGNSRDTLTNTEFHRANAPRSNVREHAMKVGIVGSGYVGATAGYALVMQGIGREIVFVDKNTERAAAEADDIRHAVPFAYPLEVRAGSYADLAGSRVVVICAGVGQKPGETRLQLLKRNSQVFGEVVPQVLAHAPEAILVVATNPVDVMTHLTARYAARSGVQAGRVVGSGTTLDTARFRSLLGRHCGVDSHHVHAYVIGEHGDSEVLTWSLATIGGMPLEEFARLREIDISASVRQSIDQQVRRAAYSIIAGKGATYYGIGSALARIVNVILHDQRAIMTVCTPSPDVLGVPDTTVSLPRLVGGQGVIDEFPQPLNGVEVEQLRASARIIRTALDELDRDS
jgi:L-lactate dehydrogenase